MIAEACPHADTELRPKVGDKPIITIALWAMHICHSFMTSCPEHIYKSGIEDWNSWSNERCRHRNSVTNGTRSSTNAVANETANLFATAEKFRQVSRLCITVANGMVNLFATAGKSRKVSRLRVAVAKGTGNLFATVGEIQGKIASAPRCHQWNGQSVCDRREIQGKIASAHRCRQRNGQSVCDSRSTSPHQAES